MLPIGHFAVGSSAAFIVNLAIYAARRCRTTFRHLVIMPISIVCCGLWAFGPDWIRMLAMLFHLPYTYSGEAHRPGWPDIFFFHGYLDTNFARKGTIIGLAVTIFIFSSLIAIYLLEIRRLLRRLKKSHIARHKRW